MEETCNKGINSARAGELAKDPKPAAREIFT
jgi:hypothetical protein